MKRIFATVLIAACAQWAIADGLKDLENFMKATQSARAEFTQVVTTPPKDGQAARQKTSSGSFEFQRPGRFRFVYQKPFEQTIVADGQTLWFYDVDLNQVTQRPQAQALGSTPAALLASAPDLQALRADFTLESTPAQDGLEWVQAVPKAKEGQLQNVRVGFREGQLAVLEILDSFGQRSTLRFAKLQANPQLPVATFQFKPPAGADVLKQ
jgi:outer membrane lipoprotein carrier protein